MQHDFSYELVLCLGQPVRENPTGVMQEAAFEDLGLRWRYLPVEVSPAGLGDAIAGIRAMGIRGANCTIPHKVAVLRHLDEVAPDAALIGAVNTIRRDGDRLIGENTDGKGFLRGLRVDAGVDPGGKRAVVLGAGGAARAIVAELALAGAAEIVVVNRSVERGAALVDDLSRKTGARIRFEALGAGYRMPPGFELLVNATSIGLYPDVDARPTVDLRDASSETLVCDAVPNPPDTALLKTAREIGLRTLDGLSMLVHQGVVGFRMWTGVEPSAEVMKEALRRAFA